MLKTKLIAIICAAAIALGAAGAGIAIAVSANSDSPFMKTMKAVMPELELYEKVAEGGGEYGLNVKIDKDILPQLSSPIDVSLNAKSSKNAALFGANVAIGDSKIDMSIGSTGDELLVKSEALLGESAYYVNIKDKFLEELDNSIFAPESGSKYAIPQEFYDALKESIENSSKNEETAEIFEDAIKNIAKEIKKVVEVKKENKEIELVDGVTKAKVYTVVMDQTTLVKIVDIVIGELETNEELREAIESYTALAESDDDSEGEAKDVVDEIIEGLKETKPEIEKSSFKVTLTSAEKSGYMVALTADINDENEDVLDFSWVFSSDPEKNPEFDLKVVVVAEETVELVAKYTLEEKDGDTTKKLEMTAKEGSVEMLKLSAVTTIDNENVMTSTLNATAQGQEIFALTLGGEYELTKDKLRVVINSVELEAAALELGEFKLDKSSVTMTISADAPKIKLEEGDKNILKLTEAEVDAIIEEFQSDFQKMLIDAMGPFGG